MPGPLAAVLLSIALRQPGHGLSPCAQPLLALLLSQANITQAADTHGRRHMCWVIYRRTRCAMLRRAALRAQQRLLGTLRAKRGGNALRSQVLLPAKSCVLLSLSAAAAPAAGCIHADAWGRAPEHGCWPSRLAHGVPPDTQGHMPCVGRGAACPEPPHASLKRPLRGGAKQGAHATRVSGQVC